MPDEIPAVSERLEGQDPRTDAEDDSSEFPRRPDGHRKYLDMEQDSFSVVKRLGFAG